MKYNKGFVNIVIAIIIALVVGGGVVYFATKTSSPTPQTQIPSTPQAPQQQTSQQQQSSQQQSNQQQQSSCAPNDPPSITVLSPNGGEVYTAGQQITVKWKTCNLSQSVGITLSGFPYPNDIQFFLGNWVASNIGSQIVTIPNTAQSGKYIINISTPPESSPGAEDWSNNYFTI